jgi:hypothetical protein
VAGGAEATAPVTITIDRKMPEAEADKLVAAFKSGGAAGLRKALVGVAPTGSVQLAGGANTSAHHHRHRQAPAVLGCWRSGCEAQRRL